MDNLDLYSKFKTVPPEAQKKISGGRLAGFTDINPMWRIKILTEVFGPVGIGWYYEIQRRWTEAGASGEAAVFVEVHLHFKQGDEWSKPIPGIGGNALIATEKGNLRTNDECYKMALTDALSVACKALGIGADIYFAKDRSKYDNPPEAQGDNNTQKPAQWGKPFSEGEVRRQRFHDLANKAGFSPAAADNMLGMMFPGATCASQLSQDCYIRACNGLMQSPGETLEWYKKNGGTF